MSNHQRDRTRQQAVTSLSPAQVLAAAREFFARRSGVYAAFPEKEGPGFLTLRGQGGEEIAIGVMQAGSGSAVTASSYMFDQQVAHFLSGLPPASGEAVA